jgi:hypothetical protein
MKKLLVTLNIGDYDKEITDLTFPYMRQYAQNIGADFYIIKERKVPDLDINLEKFQLYDICLEYDWIIFLDGDCLINSKGIDLTKLVEEDRVLIAKYNPPTHHFHPENIEGKYNLQYYAPFFFLVFHKNSRNCVKPYENPLNYYNHINFESTNEEFQQYFKNKNLPKIEDLNGIFLDEFLLTLNLHRYNIKTASLHEDFPELNMIAHTSDARDVKIQNLKSSIKKLKSINSILYS